MLKELLEHLRAFWPERYKLWKFSLKKNKSKFVKQYLDVYYPSMLMVPLSAANPLYDVMWWLWWISLLYDNKSHKWTWLVRFVWKNLWAYFIAAPEMLIERDKLLRMEQRFNYSGLIRYLILTKSIQPILSFYKSEIKKYVW